MPRMSEQNRRDAERDQRLRIFDHCINGLEPRANSQTLVDDVVSKMSTPQREQLQKDIAELDMFNCFAGYYSLSPFIDKALTPYGLGIYSKLILPKYCPDCGFEWDSHNPNCPQFGYDPRTRKLSPSQHKGGRPVKRANNA